MKKQKEEIMSRQKEYRKAKFNTIIQKKPEKVEEVLEDMCILGSIMKEEIIEEKKKPQKILLSMIQMKKKIHQKKIMKFSKKKISI